MSVKYSSSQVNKKEKKQQFFHSVTLQSKISFSVVQLEKSLSECLIDRNKSVQNMI